MISVVVTFIPLWKKR